MSIPTTNQSVLDPGLFETLKDLSMPHARRQAADLLETALTQRWGPHETLAAILQIEITGRQAVSLQRRLRALGVPREQNLGIF